MGPRRLATPSVLALVCTLYLLPAGTAHTDEPVHDHLEIQAYQGDAPWAPGERDLQIGYRLEATLIVRSDEAGAYVQIELPSPRGESLSFGPRGISATGTTSVIEVDGRDHAEYRFDDSHTAPEPGTEAEQMVLQTHGVAPAGQDLSIRWHGLDVVERALHVTVETPAGLLVTSAGELVPQTHGVDPGRARWFKLDHPDGTVDLFVRTEGDAAVDPARADPPWTYNQVAIVIGIGTVAGLLWYWGFREDQAAKKR